MGNRQGSKIAVRQEPASLQKSRKRTGKAEDSHVDADPLSPDLYHCSVLQAMHVQSVLGSSHMVPSGHAKSAGGVAFLTNSDPTFVSRILGEDIHATLCQPGDRLKRDGLPSEGSEVSPHPPLPSPTARRKGVLQPSHRQNHPDTLKTGYSVTQTYTDIQASESFSRHCCLDVSLSTVHDGVKSPTGTVDTCIDRLDSLKRNIAQCSTGNFPHFNNTGFAQLQSEKDSNDYDNTDNSAHRMNKSLSPKLTMWFGGFQSGGCDQSETVLKLSETSRSVYKADGVPLKTVHAGTWSKSTENSPVIIRRALPSPGSPVIVQRTPSQSPSVERRFPANASESSSEHCGDTEDSGQLRPHVLLTALSKHQECLEAREASHSIRQTVAAQICLPQFSSTSPASIRKMPEGPILFSVQHQAVGKDRGEQPWSLTGDRHMPQFISTQAPRGHCVKALTSSSCSSSESECTERKLRLQKESILPLSTPCSNSTTSTAAFLAGLGASSPTPIQFCLQPKGTPVRTCTVGSLPSTAVVLASRESLQQCTDEGPQATDTGGEQTRSQHIRIQHSEGQHSEGQHTKGQHSEGHHTKGQHSEGHHTKGQHSEGQHSAGQHTGGHHVGGHLTEAEQMPAPTQDYESVSVPSSHTPSSSTGVTEDTIKQNSQSAVFGSVSPKLLRHRRLLKDSSDSSDSQHTCPKQSTCVKIPPEQTCHKHGQLWCAVCPFVQMESEGRLEQLSHSAPSSFSLHGIKTGDTSGGASKTLGQRIREVINEATVRPRLHTGQPSVVFAKVFSKDDIFASANAYEKSCSFPFSGQSANTNERFVYTKIPPLRNVDQTVLNEEKSQAKTHDEKPSSSYTASMCTAQDTRLPKNPGHFHQLRSSRDSCSSCVSDSSHNEYSLQESVVAELTQANLSQQSQLLSGIFLSGQTASGHLGKVPVQRLFSSDTSDTLSTDRDTSCSSKRESSTSTATDDTLTSFKTRSTTNSADYEDTFILPKSLVFIRSADREAQQTYTCASESEQMTVKRKLVHGHVPEVHGMQQESVCPRTRKKRRKQLHVQSQIITASRESTDPTMARRRTVRDVYSDEISDDIDFFSCKDDISDLPSSRDDISDLPSSRDDISDLPSSRDDISDTHSSKDDISLYTCVTSSTTGARTKRLFQRSDHQPSASPTLTPLVSKSRHISTKPVTDPHTPAQQSDSNNSSRTHCTHRSSSPESGNSSPDISLGPPAQLVVVSSRKISLETHGSNPSSAAVRSRPEAMRGSVQLSTCSPTSHLRTRLTKTPPDVNSELEGAEDVDSCGQIVDRSLHVFCTDDDEDERKKLCPLSRPDSPVSRTQVVLSCTIYNSACQNSVSF